MDKSILEINKLFSLDVDEVFEQRLFFCKGSKLYSSYSNLDVDSSKLSNKKYIFNIPTYGKCFKNLRTNLSDEEIEFIELEIGGQRIDKVYGKFFKEFRYLYGFDTVSLKDSIVQKINDECIDYKDENITYDCRELVKYPNLIPFYCIVKNCIPFLKYHEIKFYIQFKEVKTEKPEFYIEYENPEYIPNDRCPSIEFNSLGFQFAGFETIDNFNSNQKLSFNYTCYGLLVRGNPEWTPEQSLKMTFYDNFRKYTLKFEKDRIKKVYDSYYIDLFPGINFSRISNVIIKPSFNLIFALYKFTLLFSEGMGTERGYIEPLS